MRSMKVFISGRISGLPRAEAERNFERGARMLMINTFDAINPLDLVPEEATEREAMKACLGALTTCDAILLLNDNKFSEGSQIEEALAKYLKLQVFYEEDLD
jgi:hypothetical protein